MALEQGSHFRVDDWLVEPEFDRISRGDEQVTIRPRETDLLSYLASRAGQVVSAEEILEHVWAGVVVGSDSIYYTISQLRKALGDDPHEPRYLTTVPKRGYCLIAPVQYLGPQVETRLAPSRRIRSRFALSILALVVLSGIAITYVVRDTSAIGIRHPIAVMPFVDLSPAGDQEWFAQGIVVELSNAMDNVEGLHVADRRSTEAVANRGLEIEEIGQLLGVKQILEGSVRQDRQNVRIAVQLVDTSTGVRLWSEIYERELSDIFAIQEDIADQVTNRLRLQVPDAGAVTLTSRRTDPQTYNDFLRALGSEGTYSGRREAVRLLHEVITQDPKFAHAYRELAFLYIKMGENGQIPMQDARRRARPFAEKSVDLDPDSPPAWLALAASQEPENLDTIARFEARAEALDPNNPRFLYRRLEERHAAQDWDGIEGDLAIAELQPGSTTARLFVIEANWSLGRYEKALQAYDRELAIADPPDPEAVLNTSLLAMYLGDWVDAMTRLFRTTEIDPNDPDGPAILTRLSLDLDALPEAEAAHARGVVLDANHASTLQSEMILHLHRREWSRAVTLAGSIRELVGGRESRGHDRAGYGPLSLLVLALEDRRQGHSDLAAERIRSSFPSFAEPSPVVAARILIRSLPAATVLAAIYLETNQEDKAEALIEAIEKEVSFRTRIGGYELADVEVLALRGRKEEALKALQSAVDAGWRRLWWFQLDYHPALDSIRDLPEFAAIRADLEARVAVDRDKVRNALRDKFATLVATRFL